MQPTKKKAILHYTLIAGIAGIAGLAGTAVFQITRLPNKVGKPFSFKEWSPAERKMAKEVVPISLFSGGVGLAQIVSSAAGKPIGKLTYGDLQEIKELNLDKRAMLDISSLGYLTGLESLSANSCKITDISALSALKNLSVLKMNSNAIQSLEPLKDLKL